MAKSGIAGMLGESTYQDDSHRVPFADGNGVADKEAENAMFAKRVRELMDDGYDMGEAVRQAMKEGYKQGGRVPLKGGKFLGEGLPAAIEWLRKKFGKDIIKKGSDLTRPTKVIEKEKTKKMFDDFTNKINTQEALTKGSKKMAGPIKNINKKSFDMQPDSTDHTSWFQQEKFFDPKALDMFGKKVPSNWIEVEKKAAQKLIDDLGPLGVSPNHPNYKHMKAIRQSAKDRLESIKVTEALGGNIQMHDWLRMNRENIKFSNYVRGKGDPVVKDELSEIKKTFTQKKSTADEIKKGVADVMKDTSPAGLARSIEVDNLKLEFPGITDDLINNILADKNPQRIAEVKATMKEALKMQEKGMGAEEIINIFKDMKRTKQASGGLAGMLGE